MEKLLIKNKIKRTLPALKEEREEIKRRRIEEMSWTKEDERQYQEYSK